MRKRAALRAPLHKTHSPYHLPEIGQQIAYTATRAGGAQRLPAPAVPPSLAVDLALLGSSAPRLHDVEVSRVRLARQHAPAPCSRLHAVPGIGKILRLVMRYEIQDLARFPRGQDFVSSGRLVKCATESAGQRYGTSGAKLGHAALPWAFSAAAVLWLRDPPASQQSLTKRENTHGHGNAWPRLAPPLARAVY
jgi:transposase